jgi:hypothetical protein
MPNRRAEDQPTAPPRHESIFAVSATRTSAESATQGSVGLLVHASVLGLPEPRYQLEARKDSSAERAALISIANE